MRFPKSLLLAAGLLLAGSVAASARPAVVTTDLNVRSGPGTGYAVIGSLRAGQSVNVDSCTGSWCRVAGGFASARYLSFGGGTRVVVQPAPVYYDDYDDGWGWGPGAVAIGVGPAWGWG
ncbi:SH3 domain-containing protein, partial [Ancylobacter sp. G4_0304]|uniref:SH3 domain-containing protein n=1 Tax=Ancylobacter sp. G4_0304 TaxID=3114289 RepID=UPI0039C733AD